MLNICKVTLMVILVSQSVVTSASGIDVAYLLKVRKICFIPKWFKETEREGHWKRLYVVCFVDVFSTNYIVQSFCGCLAYIKIFILKLPSNHFFKFFLDGIFFLPFETWFLLPS